MAPGLMTGRMNLTTNTNIAMNTPGHSRSGFLSGIIILDPQNITGDTKNNDELFSQTDLIRCGGEPIEGDPDFHEKTSFPPCQLMAANMTLTRIGHSDAVEINPFSSDMSVYGKNWLMVQFIRGPSVLRRN
jgi:hypothetical protein